MSFGWLGRYRESHDGHHHPEDAGPHLLHHVMGLTPVASGGESTVPPWGHKVRIIDRSTKRVVREVRNATGDSFDLVGEARQNLEEFSVEDFEDAWGLSTRSS